MASLIYFRTALKLALGKGALSRRILPEYSSPIDANIFQKLIRFLDRTHIYFGIGAVAIILLHIALVGIPMDILFFPAVLFLVVWQGVFGLFISWRYTPKELKKFSYLIHAQLFTGIMMGIFAYLGHVFIVGEALIRIQAVYNKLLYPIHTAPRFLCISLRYI